MGAKPLKQGSFDFGTFPLGVASGRFHEPLQPARRYHLFKAAGFIAPEVHVAYFGDALSRQGRIRYLQMMWPLFHAQLSHGVPFSFHWTRRRNNPHSRAEFIFLYLPTQSTPFRLSMR